MSNILSREDFANYWNNVRPGLGNSNSPLWSPEYGGIKCNYFVNFRLLQEEYWDKDTFWGWAEKTLDGTVRCFSASNDGDWWGFTNKSDIPMVILKWAH